MPHDLNRTTCWRGLREALVEAKRAGAVDVRDAHLEEVGRWADRLAETGSAEGSQPSTSGYYIEAAMEDTSLIDWAIPL